MKEPLHWYDIEGLVLIEPKVFGDRRGFFMEKYNQKKYDDLGIPYSFVQDNHSKSSRGTIRGLHAQRNPYAQGKLVMCVSGSVEDVAVDARKDSETYGKYTIIRLSSTNHKQLFIPPGFLHGFSVTSKKAEVIYKVTNYWNADAEVTVKWNDPVLGIDWGINYPTLSDKDLKGIPFKNL
jgi:dTDP-4-dehydrorhamnose 3,5-epimerase